MRNEQNKKKRNENVDKKNESVAQILTETTITTSTSMSTATQLIYSENQTRSRSKNEGESSNLHSVKYTSKKNEKKHQTKESIYIYRRRNVLVKQ